MIESARSHYNAKRIIWYNKMVGYSKKFNKYLSGRTKTLLGGNFNTIGYEKRFKLGLLNKLLRTYKNSK